MKRAIRDALVSAAPPGRVPSGVPRSRRRWAIAIAALFDATQLVFFPAFAEGAASPAEIALDVTAAIVLLAIVGLRWRLLVAIAAELVPGLALFPSWTAVALSLPVEPAPALAAPAERRSGYVVES